MTDIRDRLNARRDQLKDRLVTAEAWLDGSAAAGSQRFEQSRRLVEEILEIESILAQMQTADAQRELARAQRQVAEAQREATSSAERERSWTEGRAFWLRRFFTSVAVANGAGAFAAVTVLLRPDPPVAPPGALGQIVGLFIFGVTVAGLLPLALAARPHLRLEVSRWTKTQWLIVIGTVLALLAFIGGCWLVLLVGFDTFEARQAARAGGILP